MKHGFLKVASISPKINIACCEDNLADILLYVSQAEAKGARVIVFPELALCGKTCGDLFFTDTLIREAGNKLSGLVKATESSDTIIIIGFPLVVNDKLYNCAAFCQKGKILGVVPKNIMGTSEKRYFSTYSGKTIDIRIGEYSTRFGTRQLFVCEDMPALKIGIEIGTEAYASISPSCALCALGATVIANPSAEVDTVGAEAYRKMMLSSLSARNLCGYIRAGSGRGESTTDGVYDGACEIYENGRLLASACDGIAITELDVDLISLERRRSDGFECELSDDITRVYFKLELREAILTRKISASPFIPECELERKARCEKILTLQAKGLAQRITKAYARKCVIGISGGLDSCLAILVAAKAMDILGKPRTDIVGVTMPCFGTTKRTKSNAELLCAQLGTDLRCVNIGAAVKQHFEDIGHEESEHNVVYENAQARERTQVIMDIANMEGGIVVGTGDLSELALGWATYNGDHMSMYGVNGGVPKTLIRHIVAYYADIARADGRTELADVLLDILDTPVSPELLPADKDGNIAQKTEDLVGPYEIHDFYIFHMLRYGFSPDKLYRMAKVALGDKYSDEELLKWLKNFIRRFFAQQFKRSCLPDGPKIGTVGVSPRKDLMLPSDASSAQWQKILDTM